MLSAAMLALLPSAPTLQASCRSRSIILSAVELEPTILAQMWESTPKALLHIGKGGAGQSHANSLSELCAAHPLVSVKFNGRTAVEEVAGDLCRLCADREAQPVRFH